MLLVPYHANRFTICVVGVTAPNPFFALHVLLSENQCLNHSNVFSSNVTKKDQVHLPVLFASPTQLERETDRQRHRHRPRDTAEQRQRDTQRQREIRRGMERGGRERDIQIVCRRREMEGRVCYFCPVFSFTAPASSEEQYPLSPAPCRCQDSPHTFCTSGSQPCGQDPAWGPLICMWR